MWINKIIYTFGVIQLSTNNVSKFIQVDTLYWIHQKYRLDVYIINSLCSDQKRLLPTKNWLAVICFMLFNAKLHARNNMAYWIPQKATFQLLKIANIIFIRDLEFKETSRCKFMAVTIIVLFNFISCLFCT